MYKTSSGSCLKLGDKFVTSLTNLQFEAKASICSTIKENLYIDVSCRHLLLMSLSDIFVAKQSLYHKEKPLVIETMDFRIESLVFQNNHLNSAHCISDINILVYSIIFYLCQLLNLVLK